MIGDCDRCGHSIIYHVPIGGCLKCTCDEFRCEQHGHGEKARRADDVDNENGEVARG